jgi:NADH:ubiquinone oxidoreductase subunit E
MKKIVPLILFLIVGCVLFAGCLTGKIKPTETTPTPTPSIDATTSIGIRGLLNISLGNFNAELPVFIDNISVGNVSLGKPLNLTVNEGRHSVKICAGEVCESEDVNIKFPNETFLDFGERAKRIVLRGPMSVSIGGYNAKLLPVFIDDTSVGDVSMGKPLNLMVNEGRHIVKVCVGMVCENESVNITFAKQTFVDFGEQFKKDLEFSVPTVRIINSFMSSSAITVDVEFINPDKTDHKMSATIRCVYSYVDEVSRLRMNDFSQGRLTTYVKAGDRTTEYLTLSLPYGNYVIPTEPAIIDVSIK